MELKEYQKKTLEQVKRYEVVGSTTDGREIAIICRIKSTGKLLLITTYALEE